MHLSGAALVAQGWAAAVQHMRAYRSTREKLKETLWVVLGADRLGRLFRAGAVAAGSGRITPSCNRWGPGRRGIRNRPNQRDRSGLSISVAEARSRFSGQNEFVAAVSAAIAAYPDAFYSSEWLPSKNDSEGYKSWVSFTPTVDQKVLELFSGLPYPVEVRFDARVSAQEAESLREKVMARIFKEAPEIIGLTGDLAADGSLSIEYETKDLKSSAASRVIGSILASIPGGLPMPVTAQHGYGIAPQLEVVRGGRTFGSCTLGFVATRGGSQRGGYGRTLLQCIPDTTRQFNFHAVRH